MIKLPGISLESCLLSTARFTLWRGQDNSSGQPVLVRQLNHDTPDHHQPRRYQHELSLLARHPQLPVLQPCAEQPADTPLSALFETVSGDPLSTLIEHHQLSWQQWLPIALAISEAVGRLHQAGITHKRLTPQHLLVDPKTHLVTLLDLSHSTELPREHAGWHHVQFDSDSLPWLAPEQSGRINRAIDYRTDFYSLGVIFYQLFTGQLPFSNQTPGQLIHDHIARSPRAPSTVRPELPEVLSQIILKLLAKDASQRYQSSFGLSQDLRHCLQQLYNQQQIPAFRVGSHDQSHQFALPQKLYGRDRTLSRLQASCRHAARGNPVTVLVSGDAGSGKSVLAHEIRQQVHELSGRFFSGRFNPLRRDRPYSAILQALEGLVRQLLTEPQEQLQHWQQRLDSQVGDRSQLLIKLVPALGLILTPQHDARTTSGDREQHRFSQLIIQLLAALTEPGRPLVLFLDDLHCADLASLRLLESLTRQSQIPQLLLIGSYRQDEISAKHPLQRWLNQQSASPSLQQLTLGALGQRSISQLLGDTLHCPASDCQALARIALNKTRGNPFFLHQFLTTLYDQQLIQFLHGRWRWDEQQIQQQSITDNVISLMEARIQRQPAATRALLERAACMGGPFDLDTLQMVSPSSEAEVEQALWPALQAGLLIALDDTYSQHSHDRPLRSRYRFVHDRVQQAAYSRMENHERLQRHLEIGLALYQGLEQHELDSRLFEVTNHLNLAREQIIDPDTRINLAQLNLHAGNRAWETGAFDAARDAFETGRQLLPAESWQQHYNLSLDLHIRAGDAALFHNDAWHLERMTERVIHKAHHLLDAIPAWEIRIKAAVARNQFDRALSIGRSVLKQLGIDLPARPDRWQQLHSEMKSRLLLMRYPVEQLSSRPPLADPYIAAALPILARMFGVVKFSSSGLKPLVMSQQLQLTLQHGLSPSAAPALAGYGGVLCGQIRQLNRGYTLARQATQLDQDDAGNCNCYQTLYLFSTYAQHWKEPLSQAIQTLLDGHQLARHRGDTEWSAYCLGAWFQYALPASRNLQQLQLEADSYYQQLCRSGQQQSLEYSRLTMQTLENLRRHEGDPCALDGQYYQEAAGLREHQQSNHRTAICLHHYYKALLCYLFNRYDEALLHCEAGERYLSYIGSTFTDPLLQTLHALTLLALLPQTPILQQPARRNQVRQIRRRCIRWAKLNPTNHQHHLALINAELFRVQGRHEQAMDAFEMAINSAREQGFSLFQAIATERAALFYLGWGKVSIGQSYLQTCWRNYQHLDASAKLQQLSEHYPELPALATPLPHREPTVAAQPDPALSNPGFETAAVIQASHAIADEIVLEKLLGRLMQLALENAGAERAVLVLNHQARLQIEAEASLTHPPAFYSQRPLTEGGKQLPVTLLRYVARTHETAVLSDPGRHEMFMQDPYVQQHQQGSMLCLPLIYNGELSALLYLENTQSRDVFTRERLETLQLLAAQAAISIENAKLYQSLEQSERAFRSLFENAVEGIFRASPQGQFISANPALTQLLGYQHPEHLINAISHIGQQCFCNPADHQRFLDQLTQDDQLINFETRWRRQDGSEVDVAISTRRVLDSDGQLRFYEGSISDISERTARQQAVLARQKAEAANEAKSQFLATMSHEIRTPMNGILGMAQLLRQETLTPTQQHQIDTIYQSGQSLLGILNNVLDFTKAETGHQQLERQPFDLSACWQELETLLRPQAASKGLDLILRYDHQLPSQLLGDRRVLMQLWLNLTSNALKFTEQGHIALRVRLLEQSGPHCRLRFEVEDSGIGIEPHAHSRVFQHFSQADSSITRRFGGTGLGLAICKQLVELQNGQIGFSSQPGQGSLFWFELPYRLSEQSVGLPPGPTDNHEPTGQPLNILLVEDNPINQQVAAGLLEHDGHTVSIADDGFTALSLHADNHYDLVLMDIHLPDMDGVETCRRMRRHPDPSRAEIPVIALTASVTDTEREHYLAQGMSGVLAKPLQHSQLRQQLQQQPGTPIQMESTETMTARVNHALLEQHRNLLGDSRFNQLMAQFTHQAEQLLEAIEDAGQQQQLDKLHHHSHTLAGACANFGFQALSDACKSVEHSQSIDHQQIRQLATLFQQSLDSLSAAAEP